VSGLLAFPGPQLWGSGWTRLSKPVLVSVCLHVAIAAWLLGARGGLGGISLPEPGALQARMLTFDSAGDREALRQASATENQRPRREGSTTASRQAATAADAVNAVITAIRPESPGQSQPIAAPAGSVGAGMPGAKGAADDRATGLQSQTSEQRDLTTSHTPRANLSREPARESGYLGAGVLDRAAVPLEDVTPEYPTEAGLREGTVVLRLLISAKGQVDAAQVLRAMPKGVFDATASRAFLQARFAPAQKAGVDVASQMTIEVHFSPTNRDGGISGRQP